MKEAPIFGIIESQNAKKQKRCHDSMIYQNNTFENTENLYELWHLRIKTHKNNVPNP